MSEPAAIVQRALTADGHVRFAVLDASPLWDGVRRGHPQLEAGACACLTELLSAALLLQSRNFFSERLQLLLKGTGRARAVVADAWPDGSIRGILDALPERTEGPWMKAPGTLQVMRSNPRGQPYIGTLELVEGGLQAQIEACLLKSEQVQASVTLWCEASTGLCGGLLVEPMPGCPPERLAQLVEAVEGLEVVPLGERTPAFLGEWINHGAGELRILSSSAIRYHCRCSRESLLQTLAGFGPERLDELFLGTAPVEVTCDYCGRLFTFTRDELPGGGL